MELGGSHSGQSWFLIFNVAECPRSTSDFVHGLKLKNSGIVFIRLPLARNLVSGPESLDCISASQSLWVFHQQACAYLRAMVPCFVKSHRDSGALLHPEFIAACWTFYPSVRTGEFELLKRGAAHGFPSAWSVLAYQPCQASPSLPSHPSLT